MFISKNIIIAFFCGLLNFTKFQNTFALIVRTTAPRTVCLFFSVHGTRLKICFAFSKECGTLPIAKMISAKNARAWVSIVSYLKR